MSLKINRVTEVFLYPSVHAKSGISLKAKGLLAVLHYYFQIDIEALPEQIGHDFFGISDEEFQEIMDELTDFGFLKDDELTDFGFLKDDELI